MDDALSLHLPESGHASWSSLHEYVSTVIAQNTLPSTDTNEFRLARALLMSLMNRLGIDATGMNDCTCAVPSDSGDVADHEIRCPRANGRLVVDDALDPALTARQNAEKRTLWTQQQVLEMLTLQRRDDAAALRAFISGYGSWPEMQLEWDAAASYLWMPEEKRTDEDQ